MKITVTEEMMEAQRLERELDKLLAPQPTLPGLEAPDA